MKDESRKAQKQRILRVGRILKYFLERETVSTSLLSKFLEVDVRTVQRDLKALRDAGIPIHEEKKGTYNLKKDLIKDSDLSRFDDCELALIIALKDLVAQLGAPFERAAERILSRACDDSACKPVYVKIDGGVSLNTKTMTNLIEIIQLRRQVFFSYKGTTHHDVIAHPYRVAYFDGFWYLIARDTKDGLIKKYALDKITGVKRLKEGMKGIPRDLDDTLSNSINIWFSQDRNIEVIVEVDNTWAQYFKRRSILPLQEILEEREDGSLVISFMACSNEEIIMCLKQWLPHVRVLSPKDVRAKLTKEYTQWLQWQHSARKPRMEKYPCRSKNQGSI